MLAASFGTYGLVKKTAPLPPLEGLALETVLLGAAGAAYLVAAERGGIRRVPARHGGPPTCS